MVRPETEDPSSKRTWFKYPAGVEAVTSSLNVALTSDWDRAAP